MIYAWHAFLQESVVARDVTQLDNIARATLPDLAVRHGVSAVHSSTIYHFGYFAREARMLGIAYRSCNGFAAEELAYGLGVKPPDGIDLQRVMDGLPDHGLPAGFISVMQQQKAHDDGRPPAERVGIGGEIQFVMMDGNGYSLRTCHRFADYEQHFEAAMAQTTIP